MRKSWAWRSMVLVELVAACACKTYDAQSPDAPIFSACCDGRGTCVPSGLVPSSLVDRLSAENCGHALLCAPSSLIDSSGGFAACRAAGNLEGRCLPSCLKDVVEQGAKLQQRSCAQGERCLPCYNPLDGKETGACSVGSDKPSEPAHQFAACCGSGNAALGRCVPRDVLETSVSTADLDHLATDSCTESAALCVPSAWLEKDSPMPAACRAAGNFEGRCLPGCLRDVAEQSKQLERADCAQSELCLPCYNPLDGTATGACAIGKDKPQEPAREFATCCGSADGTHGHCVPRELLLRTAPDTDLNRLDSGECTEARTLCVPDAWLKDAGPDMQTASCRAAGDLEGRCLPRCLPDVARQADKLEQRSCAQSELCLPCYSPLDGSATGACQIGSDTPHEPPREFSDCCQSGNVTLGRCVPRETLALSAKPDDLKSLGPDRCTESDSLCVPDAWLADTGPKATLCYAAGNLEGRCLPACLPQVADQAKSLQRRSCAQGELCLPCYSPLDGKATGVCALGADAPHEPAKQFSSCCSSANGPLGHCLPRDLLQSGGTADIGLLGRDVCADGDMCVPDVFVDAAGGKPAACHVAGEFEGRCLPSCLPAIAQQAASLQQSECLQGFLCSPCYNPIDGSDTGACHIGSDAPEEPAQRFAACCGTGSSARGVCVPGELLSDAQRTGLAADSCASTTLCAPSQLLSTSGMKAGSCAVSSVLSSEPGLCIAQCFTGTLGALLPRANCASDERCVACSSLPAGIGCQ